MHRKDCWSSDQPWSIYVIHGSIYVPAWHLFHQIKPHFFTHDLWNYTFLHPWPAPRLSSRLNVFSRILTAKIHLTAVSCSFFQVSTKAVISTIIYRRLIDKNPAIWSIIRQIISRWLFVRWGKRYFSGAALQKRICPSKKADKKWEPKSSRLIKALMMQEVLNENTHRFECITIAFA